jgi:hypothetical protein
LAVSSLCRKQFPRPGHASGLTLVSGATHICCQLFLLFPKRVANIRAGSSPNRLLRTNELKSGEERSAAPGTFGSTFFSLIPKAVANIQVNSIFEWLRESAWGLNIVAGMLHVTCQSFSLFPKYVANIGVTYSPHRFHKTNDFKPRERYTATPRISRSKFFR